MAYPEVKMTQDLTCMILTTFCIYWYSQILKWVTLAQKTFSYQKRVFMPKMSKMRFHVQNAFLCSKRVFMPKISKRVFM